MNNVVSLIYFNKRNNKNIKHTKITKLAKKAQPFKCIFDNSEPSIGILLLTNILDTPKRVNNNKPQIRMAFCPKNAKNFNKILLNKRVIYFKLSFYVLYYHYRSLFLYHLRFLSIVIN